MRRTQPISLWRRERPTAGWHGRNEGLVNPRSPTVTTRLAHELTLEDYFTAASLTGILAAQDEQPEPKWLCDTAIDLGEQMAATIRRRRPKR